ncbi:hypothetical protein ElyMa_002216400 [Elysia marginata]|uniref:Uncharacterized protein n=1 Tax=Elysia marginata TaxID=1093978 RepID=A0AAV4FV16_9GAST|nr:hypothetical protein ElyMa_002216400 [Elysia marginata]
MKKKKKNKKKRKKKKRKKKKKEKKKEIEKWWEGMDQKTEGMKESPACLIFVSSLKPTSSCIVSLPDPPSSSHTHTCKHTHFEYSPHSFTSTHSRTCSLLEMLLSAPPPNPSLNHPPCLVLPPLSFSNSLPNVIPEDRCQSPDSQQQMLHVPSMVHGL